MVEWKKLGEEVCNLDYKRKPVSKKDRKLGPYPYYGANGIQDYVDSYIFDDTLLLLGEDGSVVNTDGTPILHWVTGKVWVNNHAHVLSQKENHAILRYLFYILQNTKVTDIVKGTPPKINQKNLNNITLPIPSLSEQQRIVETLDTFTASIDNLQEQIAQRRKQYEHYREQLFSFEGRKDVEWKTLAETGTFTRGKRFVRADNVEEGVPCIHYGDMYTKYGLVETETQTHLTEEKAAKLRFAHKGDVVIVAAGENDWDIGVGMAWMGEDAAAVHDACFIFEHKQNPMYIAYYMRTYQYHHQIQMGVVDGKICSISALELGKAIIPLPSLDEQSRIVSILDSFEASIANLEEQLALRQKQYEYYREKLLTF